MGFLSSLLGHAAEVDVEKVERELEDVMAEGELIDHAFAVFRDLFVFTNKRLILIDKQGVRGAKQEFLSIPYAKITMFGIENAGTFDSDSELRLWIGSASEPLRKELSRRSDIRGLYRSLAQHILG